MRGTTLSAQANSQSGGVRMSVGDILTAYGIASLVTTALVIAAGYRRGPVRTNSTASFARRRGGDASEIGSTFQHASPTGERT